MPYQIRKRGSAYEVVNTDTGTVHARHTTKAKAQAQVRLLHGKEHGWQPDVTKRMPNGTVAEVRFTGKRKHGTHR